MEVQKKQPIISRSLLSRNVEQWLIFVMNRLKFLLQDFYKATPHIAIYLVFYERPKYIEISCQLVNEKLQQKTIQLFHVFSQHLLPLISFLYLFPK